MTEPDLPYATPGDDYDRDTRSTGQPPVDAPKVPSVLAPPGACDAHVHILAGPEQYPLWDKRTENPADISLDRWLEMFRTHLQTLGCDRTVIVQSILYGTDNSVAIEAVRRLGGKARGVCLVPDAVEDATLDRLADAGMKGVRLNHVHGGVLSWEGAKAMADRLSDRGMHIEMLAHSDRHIEDLAYDIRALPVPVVFDHAGWPADGIDAAAPGFDALRALMDDGRAYVKLSGLYRFCDAPYEDADALVARLAEVPERCLWGSDWPHIMLNGRGMPDAGALLDAFNRVVTAEAARQAILVDTPADLFGF